MDLLQTKYGPFVWVMKYGHWTG